MMLFRIICVFKEWAQQVVDDIVISHQKYIVVEIDLQSASA